MKQSKQPQSYLLCRRARVGVKTTGMVWFQTYKEVDDYIKKMYALLLIGNDNKNNYVPPFKYYIHNFRLFEVFDSGDRIKSVNVKRFDQMILGTS